MNKTEGVPAYTGVAGIKNETGGYLHWFRVGCDSIIENYPNFTSGFIF
jgi:hypothetical protein